MECSNYAKYGVTRGALNFAKEGEKDVIVIAQGWPSWAFAVESAGFILRCLVVLDDEWMKVCVKEFVEKIVMTYSEFRQDVYATIRANIIISDIDLPAAVQLWSRAKEVYVGRRSLRRPKEMPRDFKHFCVEWSHSQSVGVTDGSWHFNLYVKTSYQWYTSLIPRTSRQDMSCIVNSTAGFGLECPPPAKMLNRNPRVLQIRPRTFHSVGLFPFGDRTAYFVVPSVYTKTKWCRRHLTAEETLSCLDVGEAQISTLSSAERARLCNDIRFIPSKVSVQIFRGLNHLISPSETLDTEAEGSKNILKTEEHSPKGEPALKLDSGHEMGEENPLRSDPTFDAIERRARIQKATKADDAEVPVYLWNERISPSLTEGEEKALKKIRWLIHRVWCKLFRIDFETWFYAKYRKKISNKRLSEAA